MAGESTTKTGCVSGSDILFVVDGRAIGSCTSHTLDWSAETQKRVTKPLLSKGIKSGKWTRTAVTGLSYTISFEGLRFYDETEYGYKDLVKLFAAGKSVEIKCLERATTDNGTVSPYLVGMAVLTGLTEGDGAGADATYNGTFQNDGEPSILDETKITAGTPVTALT